MPRDVESFVPQTRCDIKTPLILDTVAQASRRYLGRDKRLDAFEAVYVRWDRVEIERVGAEARREVRVAVAVLARYFKREFGYDFDQYSAITPDGPRDHVYLVSCETLNHRRIGCEGRYALGAICFRWREWSNAPAGLALAWLWINPFYRGYGILTAWWPHLRDLHGDFVVEAPLSKAMHAFLKKRGECHLCGRACSCDPEQLAKRDPTRRWCDRKGSAASPKTSP